MDLVTQRYFIKRGSQVLKGIMLELKERSLRILTEAYLFFKITKATGRGRGGVGGGTNEMDLKLFKTVHITEFSNTKAYNFNY